MRRINILLVSLLCMFILGACGQSDREPETVTGSSFHEVDHEMELEYAQGFTVTEYTDGCRLVTIGDDKYLLQNTESCNIDENTTGKTVISLPLSSIYMASSSAVDLVRATGGISLVTSTSTEADDWKIDTIKDLVESGAIKYIGKYSAPDYESLLDLGTDLAVENTMIYHSPEIKEEIEKLGIPVIVERSSYESHPLGRLEWIKLYGVLLGKEDEANTFFDEQVAKLDNLTLEDTDSKTVAFFYVTSNGSVNVRKSGDYIPKMIEMAGGEYALKDIAGDDNALSTMNMDLESFYAAAKDADIIIYNSTIAGELSSIDDLIKKSSVFADFKAVKEGNVWCTSSSTFQETTAICEMIVDFNKVISGSDENLKFLTKLE